MKIDIPWKEDVSEREQMISVLETVLDTPSRRGVMLICVAFTEKGPVMGMGLRGSVSPREVAGALTTSSMRLMENMARYDAGEEAETEVPQ